MNTVAVTGATGKLGGRVARRLEQAGAPQRLLVRHLSRPLATCARGEPGPRTCTC